MAIARPVAGFFPQFSSPRVISPGHLTSTTLLRDSVSTVMGPQWADYLDADGWNWLHVRAHHLTDCYLLLPLHGRHINEITGMQCRTDERSHRTGS